jgi:hypothetical protein
MTDAISNAIAYATNCEIDGFFLLASASYMRAARIAASIGADDTVAWCKRQATRCDVSAYRPY